MNDVINGRPLKVGVDKHSGLCWTVGTVGRRLDCSCGLDAREQAQVERQLEQQAHDDGMAWDRHTIRPEDWEDDR